MRLKLPKKQRLSRTSVMAACALAMAGLVLVYNMGGKSEVAPSKKPHQPALIFDQTYLKNSPPLKIKSRPLPLHFEPNLGQAPDTIRFFARGRGYKLALTDRGIGIEVVKKSGLKKISNATAQFTHIFMEFKGANTQASISGESKLVGKSHYLSGNDPDHWIQNVPTYLKVRYHELYAGIDLVMYGDQRRPKYDYVVAPGADPGSIALDYDGIERLSILDNGDLALHTPDGILVQKAPVLYQLVNNKQVPVEGSYELLGRHLAGFKVGEYDPTYPLVIDPVVLSRAYATYLGGSGAEVGSAIALDSSGNIYLTGRTASTDFPTQSPQQGSLGGGSGSDAYVTKLSSDGSTLTYSTYLGGTGFEEGLGIAVDSSGNAVITGRTTSTNFPTQSPLQATLGGGSGEDAFLTKLSSDGSSLVFSTYYGGSGDDRGTAVALGTSNEIHITGKTKSTDLTTSSPIQGTIGDGTGTTDDAFVVKYTSTGNAIAYATYLGGTGNDEGLGIAVDTANVTYVVGSTESTNFPTTSPLQASIASGSASDAFVTKINAAGSAHTWSTYLGGNGEDVANGVDIDSNFGVYVAGRTASTNFPTVGPFQSALGGGSGTDAFVSKINSAGTAQIFATYIGGANFDEANAIVVDADQNAHIAGRTDSTDFPNSNALQPTLGGGSGTDGFALRLNNFGNAVSWSTYVGGSGTDEVTGLAVNTVGDAYLTGFTSSSDFPTQSPQQGTFGGGGLDAFAVSIDFTETFPEFSSRFSVMNPYWQTGGDFYTFVAITHPSLADMHPDIGVKVIAFNDAGSQFGTSQEFTVSAGQTHRLFIVPPGTEGINPTDIPNATFILGTVGLGNLRFDPIATDPSVIIPGGGFPDITMLSFWGAVVAQSQTTGFAVTYLGDLNDSAAHPGQDPDKFPAGLR